VRATIEIGAIAATEERSRYWTVTVSITVALQQAQAIIASALMRKVRCAIAY
jgi:hypothetical protein